jgi:hypothetical protein
MSTDAGGSDGFELIEGGVYMKSNVRLFDTAMLEVKRHFAELQSAPILKPGQQIVRNTGQKIPGVYVFSEKGQSGEMVMYTGQSLSVLDRLKEHCAVANHERANFAYMLTVDETGIRPIPGSPDSTKASMFRYDRFVLEFERRIARIKAMDFRFVPVESKLNRNLLEMYAAVLLESKYNDFD